MPSWGAVDNNASEPKNLAEGEFQGTAGKKIYGVDNNEQGIVNGKTGDARKYAAPHAGWVGITSYTDMHGNLRVKTEVLVASSSITGDSGDDTILPDT